MTATVIANDLIGGEDRTTAASVAYNASATAVIGAGRSRSDERRDSEESNDGEDDFHDGENRDAVRWLQTRGLSSYS
jgi:hypothetical protein